MLDAQIANAPEFSPFPLYRGPGEQGFFFDFLGTRTRVAYFPDNHAHLSGRVFGYPAPNDGQLQEYEEWLGTLRAVLAAKDRFVCLELGAGWGPWLVASHFAAARLGIEDCRLVGVEADAGHCKFMQQHFRDNGIDPSRHRILNAAIAPEDGTARFPILPEPRDNWGATAYFDKTAHSDTLAVPCVSLGSLLQNFDRVDLIHCDIQGAEAQVLIPALPLLKQKVGRIVIGTHSAKIENRLRAAFGPDWQKEADTSCRLNSEGTLLADGVQVWRNLLI